MGRSQAPYRQLTREHVSPIRFARPPVMQPRLLLVHRPTLERAAVQDRPVGGHASPGHHAEWFRTRRWVQHQDGHTVSAYRSEAGWDSTRRLRHSEGWPMGEPSTSCTSIPTARAGGGTAAYSRTSTLSAAHRPDYLNRFSFMSQYASVPDSASFSWARDQGVVPDSLFAFTSAPCPTMRGDLVGVRVKPPSPRPVPGREASG